MSWIFGLSKLEYLDLSNVDLSKTQNLDSLLYPIHSLSKLSLSRCGLSIANFGSHHLNSSRELASIRYLDLSENSFRGQLPSFFLNITSLVFLDFSKNNLSMTQSFNKLLNMIPFISELRLSSCLIQKASLSPTNLNFSAYSSIQHLDLSWNDIEGNFPSILTNMSLLLSLDISENMLNSSIPVMPNLLKLDISQNKLGHIGDVGIWRQCHLKELIVSNNDLQGEMIIGPSTNVSECSESALEILYLDMNKLHGSIPDSFGRFTNLRGLDLSNNELTGAIPEALGKLRLLEGLYLSDNQLSFIPESLGGLTALKEIYLKSNRLRGPIPVSLGRLTSLRVFSVSSNLLEGPIPSSIGQLTKLYVLDLSNNYLQGVVSEDHFANLSMLKYLNANYNNKLLFNISHEWIPSFQLKVARLDSCKIKNGFPQWLQNQRKLEELVLSNASITGPLPTWLRLLPNIYDLDLSYNKLTGPLTNLPLVKVKYSQSRLLLQNNIFRGLIPRWFCKMIDLKLLDLSRNRLTGKIPKCLWNMSLEMMILSSNRLSGVIPSSFVANPSLLWLQLNDYNLNGELPQDLGYSTKLGVLDLGENKISGDIPEWIGENTTGLVAFRLHKNNFTGHIPHSLCKSRTLRILDLAHNSLTESIPHCFGELAAMKEDGLYYSMLSRMAFRYGYGNIMQTLMDPSAYADNTYLCGAPLPNECSPHEKPPTTSKNKHKEANKVWYYCLDIMSGFATGFWGIIGVLLFKTQWRHKLFRFCDKIMGKIYVAVAVRSSFEVEKKKVGCIKFK
ncbi:hypothetical protein E3N88_42631 [Mikania micrantha]|uniref:Disease resistance R13L4/SHOC-2-like LRR domain-containing protein n=1 Tax=Mikania micrantha TaxID=192012 RepID=A0A5N6LI20_9ASTR|nr:hypothetical protein E3N88_42631 [Mikania micrantha]